MKKLSFIAILILGVNLFSFAQKYKVDNEKPKVEWYAEKITGFHEGNLKLKSGEFLVVSNIIKTAEFEIDMNTIVCTDLTDKTYNDQLIGHLKSDDFFGVAKFPTAKFVLTSPILFEKGTAVVRGNLTIKGITNQIEFKAVFQKLADGFKINANIIIDRTKFDIKYGSGSFFENLGDKTIYDEFKIKLNLFAKTE